MAAIIPVLLMQTCNGTELSFILKPFIFFRFEIKLICKDINDNDDYLLCARLLHQQHNDEQLRHLWSHIKK